MINVESNVLLVFAVRISREHNKGYGENLDSLTYKFYVMSDEYGIVHFYCINTGRLYTTGLRAAIMEVIEALNKHNPGINHGLIEIDMGMETLVASMSQDIDYTKEIVEELQEVYAIMYEDIELGTME